MSVSNKISGIILSLLFVLTTFLLFTGCDTGEASDSSCDIVNFSVDNQVGDTLIDEENRSVSLIISANADISSITPQVEISGGARIVSPADGIVDFTGGHVDYILVSTGGDVTYWHVFIEHETAPSFNTDIMTIAMEGQVKQASINYTAHTVTLYAPFFFDESSVSLDITVHPKAAIDSTWSTVPVDFSPTGERRIEVQAEDGTVQSWDLILDRSTQKRDADIIDAFCNEKVSVDINSTAGTVHITTYYDTDLAAIVPVFVLSTGATIDLSSGSVVDFTAGPVQYLVTAESGESRSWTVSASCDTFTQIGAGPDEEGVDVATDSSGNVYVIGKFWDASMVADRGFCAKYSKSGRLVWRKNFDYSDLREVKKIKVEGDSIYIAGDVYDVPTGGGDASIYVFLQKFNTAGIDLGSVIRGSGNGDEVIDMVVSNGTAYILTETWPTVLGTTRHKTAVYAIEENQWDWIYLAAAEETSDWGSLALTGTGEIYAVNEIIDESSNPVGNNLKMTRLIFEEPYYGDSYKNLNVQSSGMITGNSFCRILGAAVDTDGNIILSGFFTLGSDEKHTLMKVSPTGEILWTYTDPDGFFMTGLYKHPRGVAVDSENNIYIHGAMHYDGDMWTAFLAMHDSNGERLWISPYAALYDNAPITMSPFETGGLALYGSDSIYCTGTTWGTIDGKSPVNDSSYYLLRYDRFGNRQ